jgi:hypothetical protein
MDAGISPTHNASLLTKQVSIVYRVTLALQRGWREELFKIRMRQWEETSGMSSNSRIQEEMEDVRVSLSQQTWAGLPLTQPRGFRTESDTIVLPV